MDRLKLYKRYTQMLCRCASVGLSLDISRMSFKQGYLSRMAPAMDRAFDDMRRLEAGEIANPDENRMVGHYWLRAPHLAPNDALAQAIESTHDGIVAFVKSVHTRQIKPPKGPRFTDLLVVGIGGSALGPQLVADALGAKRDKLKPHFLDNTDPDGIARTLESLGNRLKSTLVLVVSKSGGTKETRNGMLEVQQAFRQRGLDFPAQAVAITGQDSELDQLAANERWLKRFPMWDWVGGRTSVMSAVGLVPAALQGLDIRNLLAGAADMDRITRKTQIRQNPAALLALMWHHATDGRGAKDMVILPYKDRLLLLSRYLQQLIMESLGKELDLDGKPVHQGLTVYGNKGSTDQHAYVQQLRDGVDNFFVTFVVVLADAPRPASQKFIEVEPQITSGDYLNGFWQGTREALAERGRDSMTITLDKLDARSLGALIALYERAVGFYASLVNINAYHQPGVEAGKKAAGNVLALQTRIIDHLRKHPDERYTADRLADALRQPEQVETVLHLLDHLQANKRYVSKHRKTYRWLTPTPAASSPSPLR